MTSSGASITVKVRGQHCAVGDTPRSWVRWPSRQAMQHARQRVAGRSPRANCCSYPSRTIVGDLNRLLGGWAGATSVTGNSAQSFDKITLHAINRLSIFVATAISATDGSDGGPLPANPRTNSGLIDLNGTIVPPRTHQVAATGTLDADGERTLSRAVCGRNRTHGLRWGARGNQRSVGNAARRQGPLANPTSPNPRSRALDRQNRGRTGKSVLEQRHPYAVQIRTDSKNGVCTSACT